MFGEFVSESERVPSPWDSLTPPSSPPKHIGIPKLVPEADEGNVEYKLQLLSPTPARFARLVTQLKWRLLEGGGQAYYELGVADSGMLVGLPRHQLEESLETLEMMAGEIGASVIVVKEIEVPPELSSIAHSQIEKWDGKRSTRRKDLLRMVDGSPTMSSTELETELSTTEVSDTEEISSSSPATPPASLGRELCFVQHRPSSSSLPFESALAMFTVDIPEVVADFADNEATDDDVYTAHRAQFSINIEISSVYKPRPMKKRAIRTVPPHATSKKEKLKNAVGSNRILSSFRDEASGSVPYPHRFAAVEPVAPDISDTTAVVPHEPRLIVEALVVRKLSLNEVFIDFEGFSLQ